MAVAMKRVKRRVKSGPHLYSDENLRVVLTGAASASCFATTDPHDRAHGVRDQFNLLMPAAHRGKPSNRMAARARRYHLSQLVGWCWGPGSVPFGGVGLDSMFDAWWEVYQTLTREGVPLGGLGSRAEESRAVAGSMVDVRLRDVLEQRTVQSRMTAAELFAERAASALLAGAGERVEGDEGAY